MSGIILDTKLMGAIQGIFLFRHTSVDTGEVETESTWYRRRQNRI